MLAAGVARSEWDHSYYGGTAPQFELAAGAEHTEHRALSTGEHLIVLSSRDSVIVATQAHFYFDVFPSASVTQVQRSE